MDDEYISITFEHLGKMRRFWKHWIEGQEAGYPICCILRFAIESAFEDGKTYLFKEGYQTAAMRRGVIVDPVLGIFVPCDVFHHKTHNHDEV